MTTNIPKMMTVREIAATGVLTETAIRRLLREGKLPAIYSGKKAFINFDLMCEKLEEATKKISETEDLNVIKEVIDENKDIIINRWNEYFNR